ncbi:hypothetical protein [Neisseria sicca]|uniref:hypothetical protein n=1 Tax=Neisseria sicca TaxID=490 RepID=UPI001EF9CC8E|nr:hypothetical protein [Neisseria sicca]
MSDIVIFKNMPNDAAFIEWIENNQNGFVLNINKGKTKPIYPMLHKASSGCGSFPTEKKTKIGQQKVQIILKFVPTPERDSENGVGMNMIEKIDVKLVLKRNYTKKIRLG